MLAPLVKVGKVKQRDVAVGKHYIVELRPKDASILDNPDFIIKTLSEAAEAGKVTVLDVVSKKFNPQGFTAVLLLSESHISIHTWPEYRYAAIDVFTCGGSAEKIISHIKDAFSADADVIFLERGFDDED